MRKFLSLILVFALVLGLAPAAFAAETETEIAAASTAVIDISGGKLYTSNDTDKKVVILTNDEQHLLDVSISYPSAPNTVYQWTIADYPSSVFDTSSSQFWNNVTDYAEAQISTASVVYFTDVTYDEPIELSRTRSSAGADLLTALEDLMCGGEYFDYLIHSTTYQGQRYRVLESMVFRILTDGFKSWGTTITVSSLITSYLGLVFPTQTLVTAICSAFGVVISTGTLLAPGTINKYICLADVYRYVSINGSAYPYNMTDKFFEYRGYEDANNNSRERAYIDEGSLDISYSDSESYFYNLDSQIMDAYVLFSSIGQVD